MFLFPLKFRWLQRLLLNETMDVSSWNVGHVLKTAWKWSSWSLIWEQDDTNVSLISHIHVRFWSCAIGLVVCRRCRCRRRLRMFCFKVPYAWSRRTETKKDYGVNQVSTVHQRSPPTYKELTNPKHGRVNSLHRVADVLRFHYGASLHRLLHPNCIH